MSRFDENDGDARQARDAEAISEGRRVLRNESKALATLASTLDVDFANAVDSLSLVAGKIVVSGMGKSGHIGRKIAATLASTGAPAFFVHPAEAAHGDLGMVSPGDAVLMLSNSGESSELMQLAHHANKLGLPSVAITARPDSRLARASEAVLRILDIPEACPNNVAPTTSTTMALALGDALALAIMQRRGFVRNDFARLHPGGKLGLKLSSVADLMIRGDAMPLVEEGADAHATIVEMTVKRLGSTGVIDEEGCLSGVITDGDLRRSFERPQDWLARDIMTTSPLVVSPQTTAENALDLMRSHSVSMLFVIGSDGDRIPEGVLLLHQLVELGLS